MKQFREWITYRLVAIDAVALAGMGAAGQGHERLSEGLHRCQALHTSGLPWAAELVARYQRTLELFTGRYS